jgi:choline-sulfatase
VPGTRHRLSPAHQRHAALRALDLPEPKLLPRDGFVRHPWVEKQNAFMDSEASFESEEERRDALAAYWGLCEWLDHNVGRIVDALAQSGLDADVIYASDHGDNAGARGLWGKSNMYDESVLVPLICTGPAFAAGAVCETPVSLLDLSQSIPAHFGLDWPGRRPGRPLAEVARHDPEPEREILSQYHAAGAVSGAFMLVSGRWKLIDYIGFEPELFDLDADAGERTNVAQDTPEVVAFLRERLALHVDTASADAAAFRAQDALVASHGGRDAALKLGARGATPAPGEP